MSKLRLSLHICFGQFISWLLNLRVLLALLVAAFSSLVYTVNLVNFSKTFNEPLNILEAYIYSSSNMLVTTLSFLGLFLLLSDIPFLGKNSMYSIIRSGKVTWALGKMLYIILACIVYQLVLLVAPIIYTARFSYFSDSWSYLFYELLINNTGTETFKLFYETPEILYNFTPLTAALNSFMLTVMYHTLSGLLLFLISINKKTPAIAYSIIGTLHCVGYLFKSRLNHILPYPHSLLSEHQFVATFGTKASLGMIESYLYYFILIGITIACILYRVRYIDFHLSSENMENENL